MAELKKTKNKQAKKKKTINKKKPKKQERADQSYNE